MRNLSIPITAVAVALVAAVPSLAATKSPCKLMIGVERRQGVGRRARRAGGGAQSQWDTYVRVHNGQ